MATSSVVVDEEDNGGGVPNETSSSPPPPSSMPTSREPPSEMPSSRSPFSLSSKSSSARRLSSILLRRYSSARDSGDGEGDCINNNNNGDDSRKKKRRSVVTSTFTWTQLVRRRSTDITGEGRLRQSLRSSNISSDVGSGDHVGNTNRDDTAAVGGAHKKKIHNKFNCKSCLTSLQSGYTARRQTLLRSMKKATKHPRTIVLPTLLTFAILTTAGLFAIFHSSSQYNEDKSLKLLEEARELAYDLDDLLSGALLPLITLQEMAGQFVEFQELQPQIINETTYTNLDGRSFRNVTEICTDEEVWDLYQRAANSIMESSKMGNIIVNLQLQPAGTVCLNYPQYQTYSDGITIDNTKSIGLDTINDIYQGGVTRESIKNRRLATTGPIVLIQDTSREDPHETIIYWTPIFQEGFEIETLNGEKFDDYWGSSVILLDWDEIIEEVRLYEFFEERNMEFALVERVGDGFGGGDEDKIIETSIDGDEPPLTRSTAREVLKMQGHDNWYLLVDVPPSQVGDPSWEIWGSILVVMGSIAISLALMLILVSRKDHEEILCRCIPRDIVRRLHSGETNVIEKYDNASICFIDIVSFTTMSGSMKADEVMEMLQILFREFDQ